MRWYQYIRADYPDIPTVIRDMKAELLNMRRYSRDWQRYLDGRYGSVRILGRGYPIGQALYRIDRAAFGRLCRAETEIEGERVAELLEKARPGSIVEPCFGCWILVADETDAGKGKTGRKKRKEEKK